MTRPTPDAVPVAIVGAGPVGLSLALGLARHGVRSVLVEKRPGLSRHSKAPGMHVRTRKSSGGGASRIGSWPAVSSSGSFGCTARAQTAGCEEEVRACTAGLLGDGPVEVVWSSRFRIHLRSSPTFRRGRVLPAGDAAHVHSPVLLDPVRFMNNPG